MRDQMGDPFQASRALANLRMRSGESQGIPAFWFARALEFGSQDNLYRPFQDSVWVQRAIKKISGPCASVSLDFYAQSQLPASSSQLRGGRCRLYRTPSGQVTRNLEATLDLPQVRAFLREPMRGLSFADFVEATIGWMKLDECFWLIGDTALVPFPEARTKPFDPIIVARPDRMRHILENGQIKGWSYIDPQGKAWSLLPEQVIHMGFWNPYDHWRYLGEYPSAKTSAEADWLAGKFQKNLMANNGDTGPYIVAKNGFPTDAQREQILMDLRAKREAQLRGNFRPVFLTGDITVEDPQIRSVDTAFIAGRIENRHEIAMAFGVPPSMFDVKAAYSIGSASDYFQLIMDTCIPTGAKFCAGLQMLIKKLTGQDVEVLQNWDEHPVMQEVRRERLAAADGLFAKGAPMSVIDEYLQLGLPDYEGKDIGYLPINISPVGSAPADEPVQDPATDPSLSEGKSFKVQVSSVQKIAEAFASRSIRVHPVPSAVKKSASLWNAHMRARQGSVRLYQSKCSKLFLEFRITALKHLDSSDVRSPAASSQPPASTRSLVDVIFNKQNFAAAIFKALDPVARQVLQDAGHAVFDEIGQADDPWKMPPTDVLRFIAGRENKIKGVSDTVHDQIKTVLDQGAQEGWTLKEISDGVKSVFNDLSRYESRRIAMTETSAAYGYARDQAMKDAGVQYKSWLSSHGPNVREAHARAEEEYGPASPIPLDEPFLVDGEALMYPGDPSGSAGNVINCQCVQLAAKPPEETES